MIKHSFFSACVIDLRWTRDFPQTDEEKRAELKRGLAGMGWECPQILAALDEMNHIYYDRVSQIHMDRWTRGRVALIGDAASCLSLLAGEGTGMGMLEAYILAGELTLAGTDYATAFSRYEQRLQSAAQEEAKKCPQGRSDLPAQRSPRDRRP